MVVFHELTRIKICNGDNRVSSRFPAVCTWGGPPPPYWRRRGGSSTDVGGSWPDFRRGRKKDSILSVIEAYVSTPSQGYFHSALAPHKANVGSSIRSIWVLSVTPR